MQQPRRKKGWMPLLVTEVITENHDTKTICFIDRDDGGRPFDYEPGQYLTVRFEDVADKAIARSYTMSSSPVQGDVIQLTVKKIPNGLASTFLVDNVQIGTVLKAIGPIGKFCCPRRTEPFTLCMIAAGSGVTPFVSILREYHRKLGQDGLPQAMELLVSYRSLDDLIMWPLLTSMRSDNVRITGTLSREDAPDFWRGRISGEMLDRFRERNYGSTVFMICGPDEMMETIQQHLQGRGVPAENILLESFK